MDDQNTSQFIPDEEYAKILEKVPIPTVDVIIFTPDMKKTLLFYRENKPLKHEYYSLGGRLLKNENFEAAAIRKAKDEIDLDITEQDLKYSGSISEVFEDSAFNGINSHTVNTYFFIMVEEDKLNLHFDSQHSNHKWFDVDDITIHNFMKEKINKCLQNAKFFNLI